MLLRDGLFLLATVLLWIGGKNAIAIVDQNDDKKEEKNLAVRMVQAVLLNVRTEVDNRFMVDVLIRSSLSKRRSVYEILWLFPNC